MISRIFQDNTMRDKYTYEQISEATEMFLLGVERMITMQGSARTRESAKLVSKLGNIDTISLRSVIKRRIGVVCNSSAI